jgi:hypothetical protein
MADSQRRVFLSIFIKNKGGKSAREKYMGSRLKTV